jgi:restriction system protein
MLGGQSKYAEECYRGKFIGADYGIRIDLSNKLPENWREFNKEFIPIYLNDNPDKTKVAAGLACGMLWTISKGIKIGDIVICPDGKGLYYTGEVTGDYKYIKEGPLPHRREVEWYSISIERSEMSPELQASTRSSGTTCQITNYAKEIDSFLAGENLPSLIAKDQTVEDPSVFALEKHLEDFLVQNWKHTVFGEKYSIYEEEGELVGQQYPSDTGPIDILAISKDNKELLVIELKKGRASDNVLGQLQRYMGYVVEELAEKDQVVKGVIIALEEDIRLRRALAVSQNIEFYRYQVNFKLFKA